MMNRIQETLLRKFVAFKLWKDEKGQGMVEYGLIIALVAIALIAILGTLSGSLNNIFNKISNTLNTAGS